MTEHGVRPRQTEPQIDDRPEVWLRASYWWASAATASFVPYVALYFRQQGLSGVQVGLLAATLPLGAALLAPCWGLVADSRASHLHILRVALATSALMAMLLAQATSFGPGLALMALVAIFAAPIGSLLDSYGITISERRGVAYGRLRIWGTLGYVAAAWVVGGLMGGTVSRLFLWSYAVCMLLALASTLGLSPLSQRPVGPVVRGLHEIVHNRCLLLLLLTTYLVWTGAGIMYNYLGIYLSELGGSARLLGAAFATAALSELPVLAFSAWAVTHLGSRRMLTLAIVAYCIRFLLYSTLPSAGWVLAVQLMHGLTYGMFLMASVTLAHQLAGRRLAATAQGLLSSASVGFGMITGSLLGGALLDLLGVAALFRVAAVLMLVALGVHFLGQRALDRGPSELVRSRGPHAGRQEHDG